MTRDVITLCPLTATMAGGSSSRHPASPCRCPSPCHHSASPHPCQYPSPQCGSVFGLPLTICTNHNNRDDHRISPPSDSPQCASAHTHRKDRDMKSKSCEERKLRRHHEYGNSPVPDEWNQSRNHSRRSPEAHKRSTPDPCNPRTVSLPQNPSQLLNDPKNHPLNPDNPPADLYEAEAHMQRIEAFVKAILNVESVKYSTLALFQMGNLSSIVLELMKLMISPAGCK